MPKTEWTDEHNSAVLSKVFDILDSSILDEEGDLRRKVRKSLDLDVWAQRHLKGKEKDSYIYWSKYFREKAEKNIQHLREQAAIEAAEATITEPFARGDNG